MSTIFVSRKFSNDPEDSRTHVTELARRLILNGHLPLAPQIYLPQFINEATERDLALRFCLEFVGLSDEVRVYGDIGAGTRLEIVEAHRLGIPVVDGVTGEQLLPKGEPPQ